MGLAHGLAWGLQGRSTGVESTIAFNIDGDPANDYKLLTYDGIGPYINNGSVNGMYMWNYVGPMSHNVDSEGQNHTMVLSYRFKDSGEQDFWRFRERVVAARKAMENTPKGSMHTVYCTSGCNGNLALILFEYESFTDQQRYNQEELPKMIEKYNELFGNDAYEQDGDKVDQSLLENGRVRIHMRFIPEASSD